MILKRTSITLLLILAFGTLLRLISLNQSLWLDEAITAVAVKNHSIWQLITIFAPTDFHPPLYYLLLKFWTSLFGFSEISLRFPSVLFSIATGFFIFKIAKKLGDAKIALVATMLWAINPLAIYYSQEARMYSLVTLAVTAAFYFFLQKKWLLYGFSMLVAIYVDYLPFLLFPVFFFLASNKKKFIIYHLSFIILFLPWLSTFFLQLHTASSSLSASPDWAKVLGNFDLKSLPLTLVKFIIGRISIDNKILYGLMILPVLVVNLFILSKSRSKKIWLWFALPLLLGTIISLKIPIFSYFRFLFVLPAFILLLSFGIKNSRVLLAITIFVSLFSLAVFNLNPEFQREDWRSAVKYINNIPGVVLMPSVAQNAPLQYYNPGLPVFDKNSVPKNLSENVYLLRYVQEIFDPKDSLKTTLENENYHKVEERGFNGVLVWKYTKI